MMMRKKNLLPWGWPLAYVSLAVISFVFSNADALGDSDLRWEEKLVVFATLHRSHPIVDENILSDVPENIEIQGTDDLSPLNLEPERVSWEPGERINLERYLGEEVGDTAYVFTELHSPEAQTVKLGIGADWWIECWMNGVPFFDTLDTGNPSGRFSILDNKAEVDLKEGRNVLAMRFIRGRSSAYLALGDESMFAAERRRLAQLYGLNELPEKFSDRLLFPERATGR